MKLPKPLRNKLTKADKKKSNSVRIPHENKPILICQYFLMIIYQRSTDLHNNIEIFKNE